MNFVLNRNKTYSSTQGHTIHFAKGVATHVPPEMWAEVQAFGALPQEDIPEEVREEGAEPLDPVARKEKIFAAMKKCVLDAKRGEFSGTGLPHVGALKDRMGFAIDAKERDKLWQEFRDLEAAD